MLLKAIIDHFDVECAVFNSEHVPGNTKTFDPDLVGFAFFYPDLLSYLLVIFKYIK